MKVSNLTFAALVLLTTAVPAAVAQGAYTQMAAAKAPIFVPSLSEVILYSFSGENDGGAPFAGMIFDKEGKLYGTTTQGGVGGVGTVFELTPSSNGWDQTTLYNFTGGAGGGGPSTAGLIFDHAGDIYGTTGNGGAHGFGTVFELKPNSDKGWTEKVLYSFRGNGQDDGQNPSGGVIFDDSGNLYGTTVLGGRGSDTCPAGCGTVFKLTPSRSGWKETRLYSFKGNEDGAGVAAGVIFDKAGSLYGTTSEGGTGYGNVFTLARVNGRWKEQVLYRFTGGSDGGTPYAGLTFDRADNIYGTTFYGGTAGYGTVFKLALSKKHWRESVLHSFTAGSDGGFPYYGTLLFDKAGNLYGTTLVGGCCADGVAFELSPSKAQWKETVLYSFSGEDGCEPVSGLVFDAVGRLYGTTSGWGGLGSCNDTVYGCGVAFELTP
jgi:uncharacterized repeat protein (TIGR03803 family)